MKYVITVLVLICVPKCTDAFAHVYSYSYAIVVYFCLVQICLSFSLKRRYTQCLLSNVSVSLSKSI